MIFSHLKNENKLVSRFINCVQFHDLLGIAAEHQHGNLVLNLLDPTRRPTSSPQELCCIFNARLFMRRSTNRAEISSGKKRKKRRNGLVGEPSCK
mgnify:CR=1 FL=1